MQPQELFTRINSGLQEVNEAPQSITFKQAQKISQFIDLMGDDLSIHSLAAVIFDIVRANLLCAAAPNDDLYEECEIVALDLMDKGVF